MRFSPLFKTFLIWIKGLRTKCPTVTHNQKATRNVLFSSPLAVIFWWVGQSGSFFSNVELHYSGARSSSPCVTHITKKICHFFSPIIRGLRKTQNWVWNEQQNMNATELPACAPAASSPLIDVVLGSLLCCRRTDRAEDGEGSLGGVIAHALPFVHVGGRGVLCVLCGSLTSLTRRAGRAW